MITTAHVEMTLPDTLSHDGESLMLRDHRILAAAHHVLSYRPNVISCDLSTVSGPVVFVVTLAGTGELPWYLEQLTYPATVQVVSPAHSDSFVTDTFELAFSVSA